MRCLCLVLISNKEVICLDILTAGKPCLHINVVQNWSKEFRFEKAEKKFVKKEKGKATLRDT